MTQPQTPRQFLDDIDLVELISVHDQAKKLKVEFADLLKKIIGLKIDVFILADNWKLEIDNRFETDKEHEYIKRSDYEKIVNEQHCLPAYTENYSGFLSVPKHSMITLVANESTNISDLWSNESEYIELIPSRKICRSDCMVDPRALSLLEEKQDKKNTNLTPSELLLKDHIQKEYSGDAQALLDEVKTLKKENAQLKKGPNKVRSDKLRNDLRIIAGLAGSLYDAQKQLDKSMLIKKGGDLNVEKLVMEILQQVGK